MSLSFVWRTLSADMERLCDWLGRELNDAGCFGHVAIFIKVFDRIISFQLKWTVLVTRNTWVLKSAILVAAKLKPNLK